MRTLIWHIEAVGPGAAQRESYRLDGDYNPVRVWLRTAAKPTAAELIIDINVDGASIFSYQPRMKDEQDVVSSDFASVQFSKDSLVTLDIDQADGIVRGLTVGLELEEA